MEQIKETLPSLILAYGFFNRVFMEKPEREFILSLAREDLFADWPLKSDDNHTQTGLRLLREFFSSWKEEYLQKLEADFHRLFIGPDIKAVPWESAWLSRDHLLFEKQTMEVRAFYRAFDLQAPALNTEPDDHLALEFAFMVHLFTLILGFADAGDESKFNEVIKVQHTFFSEHIITWAPEFLNEIIDHAETDYYRGAAMLCTGCLEVTTAWGKTLISELITNQGLNP